MLLISLYWGYHQSFVILNRIRVPQLDNLAVLLTEFGNGFYVSIFALVLACGSSKYWKVAFEIIVCVLVTALIVQICKQVLFSDWYRPAKLLRQQSIYILLNPVPEHNSFPSGHSVTVMSASTVLSRIKKNFIFQFSLAILACLVAYTRIYVGAHFPADVAVGSLLGIVVSTFVIYLLRNFDIHLLEKIKHFKYLLYLITLTCIIIAVIQNWD
ncbi:MAG: phosphatase PAP2 family protein [Bacteroidia bacterium]|nr:phosphatase PAP2 family protein [Bacteroidia bacterium]